MKAPTRARGGVVVSALFLVCLVERRGRRVPRIGYNAFAALRAERGGHVAPRRSR